MSSSKSTSNLDVRRLLATISAIVERSDSLGADKVEQISSFLSELEKSIARISDVNDREFLKMNLSNIKRRLSKISTFTTLNDGKSSHVAKDESKVMRSEYAEEKKDGRAGTNSNVKRPGESDKKKNPVAFGDNNSNNSSRSSKYNSVRSSSGGSSGGTIGHNIGDAGQKSGGSTIDELLVSSNEMWLQQQVEQQDHDRIKKENLVKQLAELVPELLSQSKEIQATVKHQNIQLDKIGEAVDSNVDSIKEQTKKMERHTDEETASLLSTLKIVSSMVMLFVSTYVVIKIFPKPLS